MGRAFRRGGEVSYSTKGEKRKKYSPTPSGHDQDTIMNSNPLQPGSMNTSHMNLTTRDNYPLQATSAQWPII